MSRNARFFLLLLGWIVLIGASLALLLSCSSTSNSSSSADRFIGTWLPTSGEVSIVCPSDTPDAPTVQTAEVTDPVVWRRGASTDLVQDDATCPLPATIDGDTARASNQTCADIVLTSYAFTLNADGTAKEQGRGSYQDCTYSRTATYKKQ